MMATSALPMQMVAAALIVGACSPGPSPGPAQASRAAATAVTTAGSPAATPRVVATPLPSRTVHDGTTPVVTGTPIEIGDLSGRIVFDDFEDLYAMDVDGSNVVTLADNPAGPEFDGAWSPDGEWVVYRDSTRGINVDDEIFIARVDGSDRRNLTNNPAGDWGPDWSPDGQWIAFNSDREGAGRLTGWLVHPDGTGLRKIPAEGWVEYPSFSPDGTRIVYESAIGSDYEVVVADLATGATTRLTNSPGGDGWPVWSPDGTTIAFSSERDDCGFALRAPDCWTSGDVGDHRTVWLMDADGSNLRRVTTEHGQFLAWSPDGSYLLVSGYALFVLRPDGTGRLELRAEGIDRALGGIPDWR